MYIRQASPSSYRQVLREVRQKEIYKLIVDTKARNIQHFFRAVSLSPYTSIMLPLKPIKLYINNRTDNLLALPSLFVIVCGWCHTTNILQITIRQIHTHL